MGEDGWEAAWWQKIEALIPPCPRCLPPVCERLVAVRACAENACALCAVYAVAYVCAGRAWTEMRGQRVKPKVWVWTGYVRHWRPVMVMVMRGGG